MAEYYTSEVMATMAKVGATKVVVGVPMDIKPIIGAPDGQQRIRLRNTSVGKVFIKTADGIRCFILADCGSHWAPIWEQARNARPI